MDGTIDNAFGEKGTVTADFGTESYFYGAALQSDGKIAATGGSYQNESIMVRFNSDGSIDDTFSTIILKGNGPGFFQPIIQADGKIIVTNSYQIYRFNSDGSLDNSFANEGRTDVYYNGIALQSDQKTVACGSTDFWPGGGGFQRGYWSISFPTIVRMNADGSEDLSFGNSGIVQPLLFGAKPCDAIAVQPDNKILIGGNFWSVNTGSPNNLDPNLVYIIRLNTAGTLDTTFADSGILMYSMPKSNDSISLTKILVLPNGNIFAAGSGGTFEVFPNGMVYTKYVSPILKDSQNGIATAAVLPSGNIVMNWQWGGAGYIYLIEP